MLFNFSVWSGLNNEPLVIKSIYVCCNILISFGNSWEIFKSGKTFGCTNGLENSSNDNAGGSVFRMNFGVSLGVGVSDAVDFVCKVCDVVGVATEFCTVLGVDTVTGEDWVVWTDVVEVGLVGLAGFTGDTGFVGLVAAFLQVSDVVTQGCHTGLPYGFGHVEERVWVMLPV